MKLKSNQTRTYDGDGYKKRAACLCFRSESEEENFNLEYLEYIYPYYTVGSEIGNLLDTTGSGSSSFPVIFLYFHFNEVLGERSVTMNQERKHRTYVYVLIVTEVLEDWEDSVNIGRKREWFKIEDAIKVLQYHKPVQASYFETLRQGYSANNGTPLVATTYSVSAQSSMPGIR
ncbi:hypothetical protein EI555_016540 [Monodon monoceros]|uniref:Nudix hydrolase domain-containing protein n=1 Tax=Monodon monoceros TaxID=40151 RepID=A0A4U1FIE0_MONMO|nr:hypothetical protein EI555_016540 [Monodon monoceros]